MKFLLDVCVASLRLQDSLAAQGHDVLSALERNPRATDEELLALAMEERRILVTEDKDFGELVFVRRLPHRKHEEVWGNQAAHGSASTRMSPVLSPGYHCSNFLLSVP